MVVKGRGVGVFFVGEVSNMLLRFVIEHELEGTFTKELGQQVGVEVRQGVFVGTNGGEFVVKHHMVLRHLFPG